MENDHDLLIKIHTILEGVVEDGRDFRKSNYADMEKLRASVIAVDANKVGLVEYNRHITESLKRDEKVDKDIDALKKVVYVATGILAVAQFVAPLIIAGKIHF